MREVIDSHAHIGSYGEWNCGAEQLCRLMEAHGVKCAVVGNLKGNEKGAFSAGETLKRIEPFASRLRTLLWVRPGLNGDAEEARRTLSAYPNRFVGMKVHPATAGISPDRDAYLPYYDLCESFSIPFVSHTERDGLSDIALLARAALRHKRVNFIAVHMEMRTDHEEAIRAVKEIPNLYGDTTLVSAEDALRAVRVCGADKILFGSDAPVIGNGCYDALEEMRTVFERNLSEQEREAVMEGNCRRLFGL